jgi:2-dehydropantoate 2-reductase
MKTLICGSGPIGRWLALRLDHAGIDVTLLARNATARDLRQNGIEIVDGLTGERLNARPKIVDRLDRLDRYDLVVVAMNRSSRLAVCPTLAQNRSLRNILFLGNDVDGFRRSFDLLPKEKVILGFPIAGGGWRGDDLVVMDRQSLKGPFGEIHMGEINGIVRQRTLRIARLFEAAGIRVNLEKDMDGWLKYHFAFMAPTTGVIFAKGGSLRAVAEDPQAIHTYCRACREAGDVLQAVGYRKRQPAIFNLYYWLPRWLEPIVFGKLFGSKASEIRFGLHARTVGPELLEMAADFNRLKHLAGLKTPTLDKLLDNVPRPGRSQEWEEVA